MNQRIALVRKESGKTQQEFADSLSLTKNFVSLLETGGRTPSDRTISDICREYSVSESWLRTGDGEMYVRLTRDEELAKFLGEVTFAEDSFKRRLLSVLSRLDESEWELLERMAHALVEEEKKTGL